MFFHPEFDLLSFSCQI